VFIVETCWCFRENFREMNFRVSFCMTFSTLFSTKVHKMFLKYVVNFKGNLCENFSENKFNDSSLENTRKKTFLLSLDALFCVCVGGYIRGLSIICMICWLFFGRKVCMPVCFWELMHGGGS
jgi:hypothetical protein